MEKNIVVQGDLVSIAEEGLSVLYTIRVGRGQELVDPQKPDAFEEVNNEVRKRRQAINSIHLGIVSIGQGVTAYHELQEEYCRKNNYT